MISEHLDIDMSVIILDIFDTASRFSNASAHKAVDWKRLRNKFLEKLHILKFGTLTSCQVSVFVFLFLTCYLLCFSRLRVCMLYYVSTFFSKPGELETCLNNICIRFGVIFSRKHHKRTHIPM